MQVIENFRRNVNYLLIVIGATEIKNYLFFSISFRKSLIPNGLIK
jgi:hypothetical protein